MGFASDSKLSIDLLSHHICRPEEILTLHIRTSRSGSLNNLLRKVSFAGAFQNVVLECNIKIHLNHLHPELDEKFVDLILRNWSWGNPAKSIARVLEEKEDMNVFKIFE